MERGTFQAGAAAAAAQVRAAAVGKRPRGVEAGVRPCANKTLLTEQAAGWRWPAGLRASTRPAMSGTGGRPSNSRSLRVLICKGNQTNTEFPRCGALWRKSPSAQSISDCPGGGGPSTRAADGIDRCCDSSTKLPSACSPRLHLSIHAHIWDGNYFPLVQMCTQKHLSKGKPGSECYSAVPVSVPEFQESARGPVSAGPPPPGQARYWSTRRHRRARLDFSDNLRPGRLLASKTVHEGSAFVLYVTTTV